MNFVSDTEATGTVTPDANDPTQTACQYVRETIVGAPVRAATSAKAALATTPATITPQSCIADGGIPVQIDCSAPTIASVTPDGWWAGQTQEITITGSGFLKTSEPGGPTSLTVSASGVKMTNPEVVSDTQITASVDVTKKAPAETVTLKVTNKSSNGGSKSATADPAPVVLPVPIIKWRGNEISGDNAKEQSVIVGQPVELTTTPATLPGGFTVSKSTWTVDGTNIKQYHEDDDDGISVDETDLNATNTSFYWLYPDTGLNVTYEYCATDPNGNQLCTSPQAKATFKTKEETVSLSTWDSKEATIEQLVVCTDNNKKAPYLGYGDLSGPAPGCSGSKMEQWVLDFQRQGHQGENINLCRLLMQTLAHTRLRYRSEEEQRPHLAYVVPTQDLTRLILFPECIRIYHGLPMTGRRCHFRQPMQPEQGISSPRCIYYGNHRNSQELARFPSRYRSDTKIGTLLLQRLKGLPLEKINGIHQGRQRQAET